MRIALAGGGTGGHVVPGLHLLEHLIEGGSRPTDVLWFGAGRPIEERVFAGRADLLAQLELERIALDIEPPSGGAPSRARLLARTLPSTWAARRALRAHRSDVLIGLGGYTTLPAVLAARSLGIPVTLLEINAVAGKATRSLAPLARRVFHAWPTTLPGGRTSARHIHVGPPLPAAFASGEPTVEAARAARLALGFDPERPLLVLLGGSQGALALNRFAREHAADLTTHGLQVLHQVGPNRTDEGAAPVSGYRLVEYVDDVAQALAAATIVLTRGGASTVAEIAACARPALVVPYPHHADRHQERNARLLGDGVRIVPEEQLGSSFVEDLVQLASDAGASDRRAMASALRSAVPTDAGARIAADLSAIASGT